MAKRSRRSSRAERRAAERAGARGRGSAEGGSRTGAAAEASDGPSWQLIGGVVAAVAAVLVIGVVVLGGGGGGGTSVDSVESAELLVAARQNAAGSTISVYRGNAHTVMHADAPLPTAEEPRADGRPTLVWFSGTWCHFCERMEPFAHETASQFTDQVVFMEKSVDHDRGAASRYGVRGTPTFVLIDASGREITRFFYQDNPSAFTGAILDALSRIG